MQVYWKDRWLKQADIVKDIEKDGAKRWEAAEPRSHVLIGEDRIFINPPDYGIDGYSLTVNDLKELLKKLQAKRKPQTAK